MYVICLQISLKWLIALNESGNPLAEESSKHLICIFQVAINKMAYLYKWNRESLQVQF